VCDVEGRYGERSSIATSTLEGRPDRLEEVQWSAHLFVCLARKGRVFGVFVEGDHDATCSDTEQGVKRSHTEPGKVRGRDSHQVIEDQQDSDVYEIYNMIPQEDRCQGEPAVEFDSRSSRSNCLL